MDRPRIVIVQADITALVMDAIVNAANSSLLGGGGVDGAIQRAAGPALLDACRRLGGCPAGEVRLTPGFRLPARHVIHAVGPVWHGGGQGEAQLLASCYQQALRLCESHQIATIAFPAISCGVYGYPLEKATEVALRTIATHLLGAEWPRQVTLVAFAARDAQTMRLVYRRLFTDRDQQTQPAKSSPGR